eukprot:jgi/Mesen1/1402/ME000130S00487
MVTVEPQDFCNSFSDLHDGGACLASTTSGGYLLEIFGRPLRASDRCESYLLIPAENTWHPAVRSTLYMAGLLYCFLGLAASIGLFMKALETIVSKRVEVQRGNPAASISQKKVERYWNATIANISLLALGTSAPEVLLALIEAVKHLGKPPGELGPGTILGSAAFNLLMILAVCVVTPASGSLRRIESYAVFLVELLASFWAYIWLLIILQVTSPGVIEIWEAAVTLLQFPLFILVAYGQDQEWAWAWLGRAPKAGTPPRDGHLEMMPAGLTPVAGPAAARSKSAERRAGMHLQRADSLKYRAHAVRMVSLRASYDGEATPALANGEREEEDGKEEVKEEDKVMHQLPRSPADSFTDLELVAGMDASNGMPSTCHMVVRHGGKQLLLRHKDQQGAAAGGGGSTGTSSNEGFSFLMPVTSLSQPLVFEVYAHNSAATDLHPQPHPHLHPPRETFVGQYSMDLRSLQSERPWGAWAELVSRQGIEDGRGSLEITLCLKGAKGGGGQAGLGVKEAGRSESPRHAAGSGAALETSRMGARYEVQGAVLGLRGAFPGSEPASRTGSLEELLPSKQAAARRTRSGLCTQSKSASLSSLWRLQLLQVMTTETGDKLPPSVLDLAFHFFSFYWKLLFALVPPPSIVGGWAAFLSCLVLIGCITALLGEFATLFSCASGLHIFVTAIVLVAVGTSIPDLLASKIATELSPEADAAIANINGSNAVNVFLGVGLPWLVTAIHDRVAHNRHTVIREAMTYKYSIICFLGVAAVCVGVLVARRRLAGGELGGNRSWARATSVCFTFLWLVYLLISGIFSYKK